MLERPSILIGPHRARANGRFRSVRDPATQEVLGHVFRARLFEKGWFSGRRLLIHEEPDGSLLASVRKQWRFGHAQVLDADKNVVAVIRRRRIEWPDGRVMALRSGNAFVTPAEIELATWTKKADGALLAFHPRIGDEPLMKMAILGATLLRV